MPVIRRSPGTPPSSQISPDGSRLTVLAREADIDPSVHGRTGRRGVDVDAHQCVRPDPADGRAKLILLSKRGRDAVAAARQTFEGIEEQVARILGERGHRGFDGCCRNCSTPRIREAARASDAVAHTESRAKALADARPGPPTSHTMTVLLLLTSPQRARQPDTSIQIGGTHSSAKLPSVPLWTRTPRGAMWIRGGGT